MSQTCSHVLTILRNVWFALLDSDVHVTSSSKKAARSLPLTFSTEMLNVTVTLLRSVGCVRPSVCRHDRHHTRHYANSSYVY